MKDFLKIPFLIVKLTFKFNKDVWLSVIGFLKNYKYNNKNKESNLSNKNKERFKDYVKNLSIEYKLYIKIGSRSW